MVQAGPEGQPVVITHEYQYVVSDEWLQEQIDEYGVEAPKVWRIAFELRDLPSKNIRRQARELRQQWEEIPVHLELSEPTEDPEAFLEGLSDWVHDWKVRSAERDREEAAEQVQNHQQQRHFEMEMDTWIEENGSVRLRLARERGYKVVSGYAKERVARELPQMWIDTASRASWRERVDPSLDALEQETAVIKWMRKREFPYPVKIVWLVEPPSSMAEMLEKETEDEPFGLEFEQQEVLLVSGYLGRYNVFYPIEPEQRAPIPDEFEKATF